MEKDALAIIIKTGDDHIMIDGHRQETPVLIIAMTGRPAKLGLKTRQIPANHLCF